MNLGFIGLGTMGLPIAFRLRAAGHQLFCSTRRTDAADAVTAAGARVVSSPEAVVRSARVTFLCLTDDSAVVDVVRRCLPVVADRIIVDCSTVAPRTEIQLEQEVNAAGGAYADAPVSGGPAGARAGTLSVIVGGEQSTFRQFEAVLIDFAAYVDHVGGIGAGQLVKLCNQAVVGAQLLAIAECVEVVRRAGIDPKHLHGALTHSTGDCVMARTRFPVADVVPGNPASDDWRPDFKTGLMAKDLRLAAAAAAERNVTFTSIPTLVELLTRSAAAGNSARDWSAFAQLLSRRSPP